MTELATAQELDEGARRQRLAFFIPFMPNGVRVDLLAHQLEAARLEQALRDHEIKQAVELGVVADYRNCLGAVLGEIRAGLGRSKESALGIVGRTSEMPAALYDQFVTVAGEGSQHGGSSLAVLRPWNVRDVSLRQGDEYGRGVITFDLASTRPDALVTLPFGAIEMVLVTPATNSQ